MVTRNRVGTQAVDSTKSASTTSGGGTGGGSGGNTTTDNRIPNAPSALAGTPALIYGAGIYSSNVTLTWHLPTQATDGTTMAPASTQIYVLEPGATVYHQQTIVDTPDATVVLSPFPIDTVWKFKVRCVSGNGKLSAFSSVLSVTMAGVAQATAPPRPSIPTVASRMTMVTVTWDGKATGGGAMSPDTDHVVIERSKDPGFGTGIISVGAIPWPTPTNGSYYIDGPLVVGDIWYYRLTGVSRLIQVGPPGSSSDPVVVEGVDGTDDIDDYTIDSTSFTTELNDKIDQAIASTTPNTVPGAHIFTTHGAPLPVPAGPAVTNDLWFDPDNNNRPMVLSGGGTWVSYRDLVVSAAFAGPGNSITAPYLLPNVVQTQFLAAGTVQAQTIIATGSISSDYALFGRMDAGILNAGYLAADRIAASTISSTKLIVADMTNLADEPEFSASPLPASGGAAVPGVGWYDSRATPNSTMGRKTVADYPVSQGGTVVSTGTGQVWSAIGSGAKFDAINTRVLPCAQTDQYYGEVWVRKIAVGGTGRVTLALRVDYANAVPTGTVDTITSPGGVALVPIPGRPKSAWVPIATKNFTTADPALQWVKISGSLVPPPNPTPKPNPDKTNGTPAWAPLVDVPQLVGAVSAVPCLLIDSTVGATQEVQFASVWIRRKNTGELIVDGAITANQIAAGTITGAEIHSNTLTADNIINGTLSSREIKAKSITADSIDAGMMTAQLVNGAMFRTAPVVLNYGTDAAPLNPPKVVSRSWPALEITNDYMAYSTVEPGLTGDQLKNALFGINFASSTPSLVIRTDYDKTNSRVEIDKNGLRLYDASGVNPVVNLYSGPGASGLVTGSGYFTGNITASTITGSTIMAGNDDPQILLVNTTTGSPPVASAQFRVTDSGGNNLVRFIADKNVNSPAFLFDSNPTWQSNRAPRFYLNSATMFTLWGTGRTGTSPNFVMAAPLFSLDMVTGDLTMKATLTASTITGGTITGSTIQTDDSNPRIFMDSTHFQMTATDGTILFRLQPTAAGPVHIDTGTASYPRFYFDSNVGMRWYKTASNIDFNLDFASGSATFGGGIVAATVDATTTITGATYQTSATSYPRIVISDSLGIRGYATSSSYFFYATVQGNAFFSGTIRASSIDADSTISGATISAATITGGTITSTTLNTAHLFTSTINGATFSGTQNGGTFSNPTQSGGFFTGVIGNSGGTISGGLIRTSTNLKRVEMSNDEIRVYSALGSSSVLSGRIFGDGSGVTLNISGGGNSAGVVIIGDDNQFEVTNTGNVISNAIAGGNPASGATAVNITASGYMFKAASSLRYKTDVADLEVHPGLLAITPATWNDRPNIISIDHRLHNRGGARFTGFTAEDLHEQGLTDAVVYDRMGRPDSISTTAILAHAVKHIQALDARVKVLEGAR